MTSGDLLYPLREPHTRIVVDNRIYFLGMQCFVFFQTRIKGVTKLIDLYGI